MTRFERIKNMTIEEMAVYFSTGRYPNLPSSPCYICSYDEGLFCSKNGRCTDENKAQIYQRWLEDEYIEEPIKEYVIEVCVDNCKDCRFCDK